MKTLLQKLSSLIDTEIDQIIYLGAGSGIDFQVDDHLAYTELLVIEGDPQAAEELKKAFVGSKKTVLNVLVMPGGGNVPFYRYNFGLLNGTLPAGKIKTLYPSASLVNEITLPSTSFSTLLKSILSNQVGKRLLILDVPGQEAALLKSLGLGQLHLFQWILIRGCREALQEGAVEIAKSMSFLQMADYHCISSDDQADPEWPVGLFHCDRDCSHYPEPEPVVPDREYKESDSVELNVKGAELKTLQQELAGRARILIEKELENHHLREQVGQLEKQALVTRQELDEFRNKNATLQSQSSDLTERLASLELEVAGRARILIEKELENHQLREQVGQLEKQALVNQQENDEFSDKNAHLHSQSTVSAERFVSLEQELSSKTTLLEVLEQGRLHQDRIYSELKLERDEMSKQLVELYTLISELETALATKENLGKSVDEEFQKAEGQIEMIKEIFLREKNR